MWRLMTISQMQSVLDGTWSPDMQWGAEGWYWWDNAPMFETVGFALITVSDNHVLPPVYD